MPLKSNHFGVLFLWLEYFKMASLLKPEILIFLSFKEIFCYYIVVYYFCSPFLFLHFFTNVIHLLCRSHLSFTFIYCFWPFSSIFWCFLICSSLCFSFIFLHCFFFPSGSTLNSTITLFVFLNPFLNSLSTSTSYHIISFFFKFISYLTSSSA